MIRALSVAVAFVLFSVAAANAMPIHMIAPVVNTYSGAKIVVAPDQGNPLAGVQVFVRAGLDRQTTSQNGMAALVAECVLRTPVADEAPGSKSMPLRDALLARGGAISYTVDGERIRYYLEGVSTAFASELVPLFTNALRKPDLSASTIAASRVSLDRRIAEDQKIALNVGMEMLNAAFYTESDAGMPQYGLPATLAGLSASDAQRFYASYYRRGGALVSAAGGIDAADQSAFVRLLDALPPGLTRPVPVKIARLKGSQHHIVTHRDIAVPWLVAQFRAPSVNSPDFGPMLVLTSFLERAAAEVAENPMVTTRSFSDRAVGTLYNFDERPASVVLFINGGFGDPMRPFNTALSVIQIFAHSKLSGDIGTMKSIAAGSYIDAASSIEDRTWIAGVFASQDVAPNYIDRGLAAIAAATPADLQRVARSYLDNPNVAIVLPRDLQSPS